MKIKKYCRKILEVYENPVADPQDRGSAKKLIYKLGFKLNKKNTTSKNLTLVLELALHIANSKRKLKQVIEKELLSLISYLPHRLWGLKGEAEKRRKFNRKDKSEESKIVAALVNFAEEIYKVKIDRDSFSGKRRAYAVQILESSSSYFDIPEFLPMCKKSIRNKSKNEFIETVESLISYYLERDELPDKEVLEILDKRILKTKHRSEAVAALNLQVRTGIISDLGALARMDDWKDKNYR